MYRIFIDKDFRNKGIGTIALNMLIDMAKSMNKDLTLEVLENNVAKNLYEKLGFKTHYRKMVLKINDDKYMKP